MRAHGATEVWSSRSSELGSGALAEVAL